MEKVRKKVLMKAGWSYITLGLLGKLVKTTNHLIRGFFLRPCWIFFPFYSLIPIMFQNSWGSIQRLDNDQPWLNQSINPFNRPPDDSGGQQINRHTSSSLHNQSINRSINRAPVCFDSPENTKSYFDYTTEITQTLEVYFDLPQTSGNIININYTFFV